MNETVLLKLKVIVERAVRPVRASLARKKKMREELLAHVTGAFEDELPRCVDEAAALIQVEKRFGDSSELAQNLQDSVPMQDRFAFLEERLTEARVGESVVRRAMRHAAIIFAVHAILTIPSSLLALLVLGRLEFLGVVASCMVLVSILWGGVFFLLTLLSNGLQQTLFGKSGRSFFKASLLALTSCFIAVFTAIEFVILLSPFLSPTESKSLGLSILRDMFPAAVLIPLMLIGKAKLISDEKHYREEWSRLEIG